MIGRTGKRTDNLCGLPKSVVLYMCCKNRCIFIQKSNGKVLIGGIRSIVIWREYFLMFLVVRLRKPHKSRKTLTGGLQGCGIFPLWIAIGSACDSTRSGERRHCFSCSCCPRKKNLPYSLFWSQFRWFCFYLCLCFEFGGRAYFCWIVPSSAYVF